MVLGSESFRVGSGRVGSEVGRLRVGSGRVDPKFRAPRVGSGQGQKKFENINKIAKKRV